MIESEPSWIDISPPVNEGIGVFPGDVPYRRKISFDFKSGNHLLLSSIETTLHVGAHADAASHYHPQGEGIEARPVEHFLGNCQVVHLPEGRGRIHFCEFEGIRIESRRVLFRTDSFPDPQRWVSHFRSFDPETLEWLADRGVILVGIDTPSVDPEDSKELESHQVLYRRKLSVLEGLDLTQVQAGFYTLVAPPLRLVGADASPVRALLHPRPDLFPEPANLRNL